MKRIVRSLVTRTNSYETITALLSTRELRTYYLIFAVMSFVGQVYGKLLPLYFQELGLSLALLGVAQSISSIVGVVVEPISGVISDQSDRTAIAVFGALILAILFSLLIIANTYFVIICIIAGISLIQVFLSNAVIPAINSVIQDGFEGIGWGLRDVGIYGGAALGLAIGGAIITAAGSIREIYVPLILLLLLSSGLLWRLRMSKSTESVFSISFTRVRAALLGAAVDPFEVFRTLSNWHILRRFCVIEAVAAMGGGMSFYLLPAFAVKVGIPTAAILFLFSAYNVLAMPATLFGGWLADQYNRKWLYVGNFAVETAMFFVFGFSEGTFLFFVGIGLYIGQSMFQPSVPSYFFSHFSEQEGGRAWSVLGMIARGVGILAPTVGGFIYTQSPRAVFLISGIFLGMSTFVSLILPE